MKSIFLFILIFFFSMTIFCQVYVNGYYRKNGTYVEPHYRSSQDGNPYNNYSYPGNTNPYTGKVATGNPDTYLKKYKGEYLGINTKENTNQLRFNHKKYYVDADGRLQKISRHKDRNGLGYFLISVPIVMGTIFLLGLKNR